MSLSLPCTLSPLRENLSQPSNILISNKMKEEIIFTNPNHLKDFPSQVLKHKERAPISLTQSLFHPRLESLILTSRVMQVCNRPSHLLVNQVLGTYKLHSKSLISTKFNWPRVEYILLMQANQETNYQASIKAKRESRDHLKFREFPNLELTSINLECRNIRVKV